MGPSRAQRVGRYSIPFIAALLLLAGGAAFAFSSPGEPALFAKAAGQRDLATSAAKKCAKKRTHSGKRRCKKRIGATAPVASPPAPASVPDNHVPAAPVLSTTEPASPGS